MTSLFEMKNGKINSHRYSETRRGSQGLKETTNTIFVKTVGKTYVVEVRGPSSKRPRKPKKSQEDNFLSVIVARFNEEGTKYKEPGSSEKSQSTATTDSEVGDRKSERRSELKENIKKRKKSKSVSDEQVQAYDESNGKKNNRSTSKSLVLQHKESTEKKKSKSASKDSVQDKKNRTNSKSTSEHWDITKEESEETIKSSSASRALVPGDKGKKRKKYSSKDLDLEEKENNESKKRASASKDLTLKHNKSKKQSKSVPTEFVPEGNETEPSKNSESTSKEINSDQEDNMSKKSTHTSEELSPAKKVPSKGIRKIQMQPTIQEEESDEEDKHHHDHGILSTSRDRGAKSSTSHSTKETYTNKDSFDPNHASTSTEASFYRTFLPKTGQAVTCTRRDRDRYYRQCPGESSIYCRDESCPKIQKYLEERYKKDDCNCQWKRRKRSSGKWTTLRRCVKQVTDIVDDKVVNMADYFCKKCEEYNKQNIFFEIVKLTCTNMCPKVYF